MPDFPFREASHTPLEVVSFTRSDSFVSVIAVIKSVVVPDLSSSEPNFPSQRNEKASTMEDFPEPFSPKTMVSFRPESKGILAGFVAPRNAVISSSMSLIGFMVNSC